jgi:hypothetical protein
MQPYLLNVNVLPEWRIGGLSILLPRHALGDSVSWQPNQILRDIYSLQRQGRHRNSGLHFIFDGWSRMGVKPRQRSYKLSQYAFRQYPGAVSQLIFPLVGGARKILVGIAHDPIYQELNNCLTQLEFTFDLWEARS